ncbi:hypothetical protein ABEF95_017181 [Exophiala dermatitidis]
MSTDNNNIQTPNATIMSTGNTNLQLPTPDSSPITITMAANTSTDIGGTPSALQRLALFQYVSNVRNYTVTEIIDKLPGNPTDLAELPEMITTGDYRYINNMRLILRYLKRVTKQCKRQQNTAACAILEQYRETVKFCHDMEERHAQRLLHLDDEDTAYLHNDTNSGSDDQDTPPRSPSSSSSFTAWEEPEPEEEPTEPTTPTPSRVISVVDTANTDQEATTDNKSTASEVVVGTPVQHWTNDTDPDTEPKPDCAEDYAPDSVEGPATKKVGKKTASTVITAPKPRNTKKAKKYNKPKNSPKSKKELPVNNRTVEEPASNKSTPQKKKSKVANVTTDSEPEKVTGDNGSEYDNDFDYPLEDSTVNDKFTVTGQQTPTEQETVQQSELETNDNDLKDDSNANKELQTETDGLEEVLFIPPEGEAYASLRWIKRTNVHGEDQPAQQDDNDNAVQSASQAEIECDKEEEQETTILTDPDTDKSGEEDNDKHLPLENDTSPAAKAAWNCTATNQLSRMFELLSIASANEQDRQEADVTELTPIEEENEDQEQEVSDLSPIEEGNEAEVDVEEETTTILTDPEPETKKVEDDKEDIDMIHATTSSPKRQFSETDRLSRMFELLSIASANEQQRLEDETEVSDPEELLSTSEESVSTPEEPVSAPIQELDQDEIARIHAPNTKEHDDLTHVFLFPREDGPSAKETCDDEHVEETSECDKVSEIFDSEKVNDNLNVEPEPSKATTDDSDNTSAALHAPNTKEYNDLAHVFLFPRDDGNAEVEVGKPREENEKTTKKDTLDEQPSPTSSSPTTNTNEAIV